MSDELFPPESVAVDSPRLKWMKKHGIECVELGLDEDGDSQYMASQHGKNSVVRMSRDIALQCLAAKLGIPDWRQ